MSSSTLTTVPPSEAPDNGRSNYVRADNRGADPEMHLTLATAGNVGSEQSAALP
jgi:hypothetical protein